MLEPQFHTLQSIQIHICIYNVYLLSEFFSKTVLRIAYNLQLLGFEKNVEIT